MNKIKKLLVILAFVFVCFTTSQVKATSNIETSSHITMRGAQIRTSGVQGLRFVANVDLDKFILEQNINLDDIAYYGIALSYGTATSDNLYLGNTVNNKRVLYGESNSLFNQETKDFTVVLYNISSDLYLQNFTARSYIKYNDGVEKIVYSENVITRSIYEVALKASENGESSQYISDILGYVNNTLCLNVSNISDCKAQYDIEGEKQVRIKGVVTAVSSGTTNNCTIEDNSGAIMLYKFNTNDSTILKVGNEVIISGTITKYNGLYEIKDCTECLLVSTYNDTSSLFIDISVAFETADLGYQSKVGQGFLKYLSTSSKKMTFKTDNETSVLLYVDNKWSEFSALNLETDCYYYLNGFISNYNGIQLIPYHTNNAVLAINSIEVVNCLDSYLLGDFKLDDLKLKITLSDNSIIYHNVTSDMLSSTDLNSLNTEGIKNITISYLGFNINVSFNILDKEIAAINLINGSFDCFVGDSINLDNALLEVRYLDDDTNNIKITNEMISGFDSSSAGTKELTISYKNKTVNVEYNVLKELVIYEVYGAGGNSDAVYKNDYVVLYNNTNKQIDLSSYKLLYASSSGTSFNNNFQLSGKIYPKSYYVIKGKSNNETVGADLLYSNISVNLVASGSSGRVAITKDNIPSSLTDSSLIDNCFYSGLNSSTSYRRNSLINDEYKVVSANLDYLNSLLVISDISLVGIKTNYKLGEQLNTTNGKIVVAYHNGAVQEVAVTSEHISGFSSAHLGTFTMTVTYEGVTCGVIYTVSSEEETVSVEIFFIDLGDNIDDCGESTYIKVGDTIDILIDAGESSTVSANCVKNVINANCTDNTLDYVIATHGHSDHIGGMRYVLPNYDIKNVIEFDYKYGSTESSTTVIGYYLKERQKAENIVTAYDLVTNSGNGNYYVWNILDGISLTFYNSGYLNTTASDKNQQSVICVFEAYGTRVLFNGDAEEKCEVTYGPLVGDVDIFKIAHHGTYNGTSATLLNSITPEVAIVCNGNYLGNEYGHPTYDALSRIYNYNNNTLVYAITGATINSLVTTTTNGPGSSLYTLYAYKTTKRCNFHFNCTTKNDAMGQRNGNIKITINNDSFVITSQYGGSSPYEMRQTAYWQNMVSYLSTN